MNNLSIGVLALVVGVIIGAMTVTTLSPEKGLGGVTQENETFVYDVTVGGTLTSADIAVTDDLTVTDVLTATGDPVFTDNSGTTTLTLGGNTGFGACINTNATSSATPIQVNFMYASSTVVGGGYNGIVVWKYGACS